MTLPAGAQGWSPILGTNELAHIRSALDCLNMDESDLGFEKDIGKPLLVLNWIRNLLHDPLALPAAGDRVLAACGTNDPDRIWNLANDLLELPSLPPSPEIAGRDVARFVAAAEQAAACLERAGAKLDRGEKEYLAAACLTPLFSAEDRDWVRRDMEAAGISSQVVARVIAENLDIDPEPAATNQLALLGRVRMGELIQAGRILREAAGQLAEDARTMGPWPDAPAIYSTPMGDVIVGTMGDNVYTQRALLILEPGGCDRYGGGAGAANGLAEAPLAAIVDLGGDDVYDSPGLAGAGCALWGAAVALDAEGNDTYRAAYMGQGGALYGAAWVEDSAGDDTWRALAHAQGAAVAGVAVLRDGAGRDLYEAGYAGQAYAGVMGAALLVDAAGNDLYLAGGVETDYDHNNARFVSLSQGCAFGMRPWAGGGVAALVDQAGSDTYEADVFAQGVSYWYAAGMLLDAGGNDTYRVYHYGQGSGIHLSAGLLADGGGDDEYAGHVLCQGNAHDYAVGMLFDRAGDDTYSGHQHAQGRAINNALALLVDSAGDDTYLARMNDECQGVGNDGDKREYGSLALLLDLAGTDRYTCGAEDGARMLRPDFGIVYDLLPSPPAKKEASK